MKVKDLIAIAKDWVEDDAITDRVRLYMLNQIEGKIQTELLLIDPNEIVEYTDEDLGSEAETELLIPAPYTDVYVTWMVAMAYWYAGEYATYQNEMAMFNTAWWRLARMIAERDRTGSNDRLPIYERR